MTHKITLTTEQLIMAEKMASDYIEELQRDLGAFYGTDKFKEYLKSLAHQLNTAFSVYTIFNQINRKENEDED